MNTLWQQQPFYGQPGLARGQASWILEPGSLTQRLKASCQHFSLKLLRQVWGLARVEEQAALKLKAGARVLIREVLLMTDDKPAVFARTIIPYTTSLGSGRALLQLGTKPLGELLFSMPRVKRGPIEWKRLHPAHELFEQVKLYMPDINQENLCARRSIFYLANKPLLVTEVFLSL